MRIPNLAIPNNNTALRVILIPFILLSFFSLMYSLRTIITTNAPDFSVYYTATKALVGGDNPYNAEGLFTGVGYPPHSLLPYIPLVILPYLTAQNIFTVLSLAALFLTLFLSLKTVTDAPSFLQYLTLTAFAVISFPTKFTLGMGQNNILALVFLIGSYYCYEKRQKNAAGILLGVSLILKPIFLFFFLFFLFKKQWRIVFLATGCVLISILTVFLLFDGPYFYLYYFSHVVPPLATPEGREIYYNQGLMGFVSRLTGDLVLRKSLSLYLSGAIVILSCVYMATKKRVHQDLQFGLLIVALVLIDTLSWQHHFVWLVFPFTVLSHYSVKANKHLFLVILVLLYALIGTNIRNPEVALHPLFLSHGFFGAVLLFLLILMHDASFPMVKKARKHYSRNYDGNKPKSRPQSKE